MPGRKFKKKKKKKSSFKARTKNNERRAKITRKAYDISTVFPIHSASPHSEECWVNFAVVGGNGMGEMLPEKVKWVTSFAQYHLFLKHNLPVGESTYHISATWWVFSNWTCSPNPAPGQEKRTYPWPWIPSILSNTVIPKGDLSWPWQRRWSVWSISSIESWRAVLLCLWLLLPSIFDEIPPHSLWFSMACPPIRR